MRHLIDTYITADEARVISNFEDKSLLTLIVESGIAETIAEGRDIRVVYSTMDAVEIAQKNPDRQVVFPGVGFETTTPTIAAAIEQATPTSPWQPTSAPEIEALVA